MTTPPPSILSVCAFLKRWAPGFRVAKRKELVEFVSWYWRDARVGVIRENGRIRAVALARCVDDVQEAQANVYYHREQGRIVWVDDIVSRHPEAIGYLLDQVGQRFGPREAFAGRVFHRDGELRMLPFRIVERLMRKPHHGLSLDPRATAAA